MSYNNNQQFDITTIDGTDLKRIEDFKYIEAWVEAKNMSKSENRKLGEPATKNSRLGRKFKIILTISTAESVLLYGCETWTLTNSLLKNLDEKLTF